MVIKKITSAATAVTLVLSIFSAPAFAIDDLQITGNGADSVNKVNVETSVSNTVVQNNNAVITNNITSSAETGENRANDNTGGDVTILTGNAISDVDVTNRANLNRVDLSQCGTCDSDIQATISGNGADSYNKVKVESTAQNTVFQDNLAVITNTVDSEAETGENRANRNTGGDVVVVSGHADSDVNITNQANANIASIGGNGNGGNDLVANIVGNGADSYNKIKVYQDRLNTVVQNNNAVIDNYVTNEAETGENRANDNTTGDVLIDTGNATSSTTIDNRANFNFADVSCCLLDDLKENVSGNGAESTNKIRVYLDNNLQLFQGGENEISGLASFYNSADTESETGDNRVNRNTGDVLGTSDPAIITGHADQETDVRNAANANFFSSGRTVELPGGNLIDFNFNLGALWGLLHVS